MTFCARVAGWPVGQHLGNHRAAGAISKRAHPSRPIMCRALGENRARASSKSFLTPQLPPVCHQAEAGGCISSPVRPSEKLSRDLPKVRRQGQDRSTPASQPVLLHEIGIECAHGSAARIPGEDRTQCQPITQFF